MEKMMVRAGRLAVTALAALALAAALVPAMGAGEALAKAPKKPGKPKAVKVTSKTSSSVTVKWGKAKRAKAYQVRVTKGKRTVRAVKVTKRSARVSGLKAGTKYVVKVRAQARKGGKSRWGSWSKTVTFRTKAAPRKASATKPAHSHLYHEWHDGRGGTYWACECGATTKAPKAAECAHDGTWEVVPGTFKPAAKAGWRYCLQCGERFRDDGRGSAAKALKAHVAATGHLTKDNDGVTHDAVTVADTAFIAGQEPVERCSGCGTTRPHSHSWTHVGDTLDKRAMGGYDMINIAAGYQCKTCDYRTSPCAKWMGEEQSLIISREIGKHQDDFGKWDGSNDHLAYEGYEIYGQIFSTFEHDHCTTCGLNRVS